MSAIFGFWNRDDRPAAGEVLAAMSRTLPHRGADECGHRHTNSIAFSFRASHTTPESISERMPAASGLNRLVITADVRLDNRAELGAKLAIDSLHLEQTGDGQLLLRAYEQWGERCVEHLVGDFAFVIWDELQQKLFCARDHFGVKPFYYFASDKVFAFATEIKALFAVPGVPRQVNEIKIADHLVGVHEDPEITFYKNVWRLPPSRTLSLTREQSVLNEYYALDPNRELRLASDAEYSEAFRELFTEAVRCRLRSSVQVGSLLSGGLDSSSITCVARDLLRARDALPLKTFSLAFTRRKECSEQRYVDAVIAQGGIEPHYVHGDQVSPWTDLERVQWHKDEAFTGGNLFLLWALYGAAQKQGVRVLLDGFDGDTTVSHGTGRFIELAQRGQWWTLANEARAYAPHFNTSWRKIVWHYARDFSNNPLSRNAARFRRLARRFNVSRRLPSNLPEHEAGARSLNPKFAQRINHDERRRTLGLKWNRRVQSERDAHHRRLTYPILTTIMEGNNNAAAAFSIEPRYPFWDKRLVEFCLSLPAEQKLFHGWIRMVMRRAMHDTLPEIIRWRGDKTDMSPNFEAGLLHYERQRFEEIIFRNSGVIDEYVYLPKLRAAYSRFASRQSSLEDVLAVWSSVSLALWLQPTNTSLDF